MQEPKPGGFLRQKMSNRGTKDEAEVSRRAAVKDAARTARRRFYNATKRIDALALAEVDSAALESALQPFLQAADLLPVSPDDAPRTAARV